MNIEVRTTTSPKTVPEAKDLAFGKYFTDHWFYSKYYDGKGWLEAAVEPYGSMSVDPGASVLHYGQALFEGMKAFAQPDGSIALFRPEYNHARFTKGAERLCLVAPPKDLFMNGIRELITTDKRWVPRHAGCALYIRPTLIGTEAFLGVRPSREILFFILLSPVGSYFSSKGAPLKIWVENEALRAAPGGLGDVKAAANYAASLQAAQRAKAKGYDQVLWLDVNHEGIEEVGTMNVFWVLKDEIVTPALNGSILAGGMRDSLLHLLRHEGRQVNERKITIQELIEHHKSGNLLEAFGAGTAAVISPIGELSFQGERYVISNDQVGPLSQELFTKITSIQSGNAPDTFGWMKPLESL